MKVTKEMVDSWKASFRERAETARMRAESKFFDFDDSENNGADEEKKDQMKITQEMVDRWKKNRIPFRMLTENEKAEIAAIGNLNFFCFDDSEKNAEESSQDDVLRLRSIYEINESEMFSCKVYIKGVAYCFDFGDTSYTLSEAPELCGFFGVEFKEAKGQIMPTINAWGRADGSLMINTWTNKEQKAFKTATPIRIWFM